MGNRMRIRDVVMYLGPNDPLGIPSLVLLKGDLCVIVDHYDEGMFRVVAISPSGELLHSRSEFVFAEEIQLVNYAAPLAAA
ncbi:MAG: hypothetical protein K2X07_03890 [Caulobacteraceae bacterium]|nr:hypothetical protein [Caulobacteraceae bacterium]